MDHGWMVGRFIMAATKYPKIAVDKPMNRQKCKFQDLCLGFQQLGDIKMPSFYWSTWRFSTSQHRSFTPTRTILDCDHAEDLQDACQSSRWMRFSKVWSWYQACHLKNNQRMRFLGYRCIMQNFGYPKLHFLKLETLLHGVSTVLAWWEPPCKPNLSD